MLCLIIPTPCRAYPQLIHSACGGYKRNIKATLIIHALLWTARYCQRRGYRAKTLHDVVEVTLPKHAELALRKIAIEAGIATPAARQFCNE
jgi:hypothetical protein